MDALPSPTGLAAGRPDEAAGPADEARPQLSGPPELEVIARDPQQSFRAFTHDFPSDICGWRAHPEYEIHLITTSSGSFAAGDHIGTFGPGQVSIMGPYLPHNWVSDLPEGEVAVDRDAVIQFTDEWIRSCMARMPELLELDGVLQRSRRGLVFHGETARAAGEAIMRTVRSTGANRLACLVEILDIFAKAPARECEAVAGPEMDWTDPVPVEVGINYIFENLTSDVRLSTAAKLAYMSEPTFSKFFSRATGLTFTAMVKKLRITRARWLLDWTDEPVARVATLSGYHNLANFNRQFRAEVGTTPTAYRRLDPSQKPPSEVLSLSRKARSSDGGPLGDAPDGSGPISAQQLVESRMDAALGQ